MTAKGHKPDMQEGLTPDVFTYATVIAALCSMGRLVDAMEKFSEMIFMGV